MSEPVTREYIERLVGAVLDPSAFPRWWQTPLPRLHNATPEQIFAAGDGERLAAYCRTYSDPNFT